MARAKRTQRSQPLVQWEGAFPRLLTDPITNAQREGRELAQKLLASLDKDMRSSPDRRKKKKKKKTAL
jgi:hypothetical protein